MSAKTRIAILGLRKSGLFCHSERSEESLSGLCSGKERGIPRFARNDKRVGHIFRALNPAKLPYAGSARHLGGFRFADEDVAEDKHIHFGAQKTFDGFLRTANDRFVVVEGSIQHHGHAGEIGKLPDQPPIARVRFLRHGLEAPGAVHVGGRRNRFARFPGRTE